MLSSVLIPDGGCIYFVLILDILNFCFLFADAVYVNLEICRLFVLFVDIFP